MEQKLPPSLANERKKSPPPGNLRPVCDWGEGRVLRTLVGGVLISLECHIIFDICIL